MTPFKAWRGHSPDVSHFRMFGSRAWSRLPIEKRKSLHPQRKESIMTIYSEYAKGYNLFDPSYQNTFIDRSVQFQEDPMQEADPEERECSHIPRNGDVNDVSISEFYDYDMEYEYNHVHAYHEFPRGQNGMKKTYKQLVILQEIH